jgi:hypothetical protein
LELTPPPEKEIGFVAGSLNVRKVILIAVGAVVAAALIAGAAFVVVRFLQIDECQDHHGAWIKGRCEY